jgi:NADH-quinone oxidoreductase subunit C
VTESRNLHDHGHEAEDPEPALSDRAQALQKLLHDALKDFQPRMGASLDIPEITLDSKNIADVCRILKDEPSLSFKLLLCLAGVDYKEHFQIVYVLLSLEHEQKLIIKTNVPYDDPCLPTVTSVWRAADWYEREAHDLFGVTFSGHPNPQPLILYEGFEGYPGRKEHPFHEYQEF